MWLRHAEQSLGGAKWFGESGRMRLLWLFVALVSLFALSCTTGAAASAPKWMHVTEPAPPVLQGTQVLFVAGYLNELIPGYFDDNVAVVESLGAKSERLFPTSEESLQEDVLALMKWVDAHEGPLWLIGHSKGGAAVLLAALRHPELVLSGKVKAVVVVQGAVGGSPVADRYDADPLLGQKGMHALTRHASEKLFDAALKTVRSQQTPEQQQALFSRIFYVRSRIDTAAVATELKPTRAYLDRFGPNDGLLLADAMKLDVGVDLGILDSDHAGLVLSSFLTSSTPERRKQFTHALVREVSTRLDRASR